MKSDLNDVVTAFQLAKETMGKIKQNLFFALFYNIIGIPIAARVFVAFGLVLKPELAGLAMAFSSISVVGNALLLRWFRPKKKNYLSMIAPLVLVLVFTGVFLEFARLSSGMEVEPSTSGMITEQDVATLEQTLGINLETALVGDESKLFYPVTTASVSQVPVEFVDALGKKNSFSTVMIDGVAYQSIYLGAEEASVMREEKLFNQPGDTSKDFFGNNILVAGILPKTDTAFDRMHFVGPNFIINNQ
jgi:hypothetical protein